MSPFGIFEQLNYKTSCNFLRVLHLYSIQKIVFVQSNRISEPKIAEAMFVSFGYPHRKWSLSKASKAAIRHR